ncbi:MAG: serine/threonine protein kinase, partial [Myxococcota bacterium]|nr:serine/threonine protein kinase [Myxococcota bacterium]
VAKFYRPRRWSEDAIFDEHDFLLDLEEAEIPVAAPLDLPNGSTLAETQGVHFALFPRIGGREPAEMDDDQLRQLGRLLARIHSVGRRSPAEHRPRMEPDRWFLDNLEELKVGGHLPPSLLARFSGLVEELHRLSSPLFEDIVYQRIHGDCHLGNLLWAPRGLVFLDFDDLVMGPPVQDFWMMQGGRDAWAERRLDRMLEGYETMADFDRSTLRLIEPLRAMRMVHFATWIARRWEDPAFPIAFPQFGTAPWWEAELRDLQEQLNRVRDAVQPH